MKLENRPHRVNHPATFHMSRGRARPTNSEIERIAWVIPPRSTCPAGEHAQPNRKQNTSHGSCRRIPHVPRASMPNHRRYSRRIALLPVTGRCGKLRPVALGHAMRRSLSLSVDDIFRRSVQTIADVRAVALPVPGRCGGLRHVAPGQAMCRSKSCVGWRRSVPWHFRASCVVLSRRQGETAAATNRCTARWLLRPLGDA